MERTKTSSEKSIGNKDGTSQITMTITEIPDSYITFSIELDGEDIQDKLLNLAHYVRAAEDRKRQTRVRRSFTTE